MTQTTSINYVQGNLFRLIPNDRKICLPHCVNDLGLWGSGYVVPLGRAYPEAKQEYIEWSEKDDFQLGQTQFVWCDDERVCVANMIGQHNVGTPKDGVPPIRYDAIRKCLVDVALTCLHHNMEIHAPKFGAGLAGGDWNEIEKIIEEELCSKGLSVTIYEL